MSAQEEIKEESLVNSEKEMPETSSLSDLRESEEERARIEFGLEPKSVENERA